MVLRSYRQRNNVCVPKEKLLVNYQILKTKSPPFVMKTGNRDLLVLMKDNALSEAAMEHEVEILNNILYNVESLHSFCIANEVIDVNKYKIIKKPHQIQQAIRERSHKPFVFICNKN